nr:ribonuclease H-like domain-containing protein [Tanacetum cinerariifolium]
MTGNISYLTNFKEHDGGYVTFRGGEKGGKITRKGTIRTGKLDFKDMYFFKELQFKLFSVSQMCDKKNSVLFTDTECFVLSLNFKLADESKVLLKVPRKNNMYSFDMKNIVPQKDLTCLLVKATTNESMLWHRRLGGRPEWLFDIDALSKSMNYAPVLAGTNSNDFIGTNSNDFIGKGVSFDAFQSSLETGSSQDYILMPLWKDNSLFDSSSQDSDGHNKDKHRPSQESECVTQERPNPESSTKTVNTAGLVNTATPTYADYPSDHLMPDLEDTGIFDDAYDAKDEDGTEEEPLEPKGSLETKEIREGLLLEIKPGYLAYASFIDFTMYQMDVKNAFLYGTIKEEVYVSQPLGFMDPKFLDRVVKSASTPMKPHKPLSKDAAGTNVDVHLYRSMIGSLMYLTSSRPDIMFTVCASLRFQVQPKVSQMLAMKRIFRYLKGQPTLGLWYPNDSPLELIAYSERDYTGASLVRKSKTRGYLLTKAFDVTRFQFLIASIGLQLKGCLINDGCANLVKLLAILLILLEFLMLVFTNITNDHQFTMSNRQERISYSKANGNCSKTIISVKQIHVIVDGEAVVISESSMRSDLLFDDEDCITCLTNDEIFKNLGLMGYEPLLTKLTFQKGGGDSVERAITTASLVAVQNNDNITKTQTTAMPNIDTPQRMDTGGSPRRQETMGSTHTQTRSERVLEKPNEPPLLKGHTSRSRKDRMEQPFELTNIVPPTPYDSPLTGENELSSTKAVYHKALFTLTKRVKKLETHLKKKRSRAVIHSLDEGEPSLDAEDSSKQGRMIGEIGKYKTINLVNKQREVQETAEPLKDDDDAPLAETLFNIKRSTTKDKGKGYWNDPEVLRYHALQNKVFSKCEVRKNMCTYLKNHGGYKQSYFKGMEYEDIRPIFKRVWDKIYTFVPKDFEIEKEFIKRSRFNLQQESSKKQKLDKQTHKEVEAQADTDQEIEEMILYVKIVPDKDIAIDAIPLATKPPVIVEYKIVKEGKISTYHITRADGSTKRYTSMIKLLENIDREDLKTSGN